ncbi:hypothetical protein Maes01_00259 [Microbulbifer aestuariivivens]|uniref:Uncharacterized protein n=1 Tax=Microbulbifer aestuariivivens TaxID=1908308 RepID=A0ABP9WKR7_9GAMM
MKMLYKGLIVAFQVAFISQSWAGENAASCLSTVQWREQTEFINRCDYSITVFWCAKDTPYIGERCGAHEGTWSDYYSHLIVIKKDTIAVRPTLSKLAIAVCKGRIVGADLNTKFLSESNGDYQCL